MIDKHLNADALNPLHRASFGVGCWDFGVRCKPSSQLSINQYVALLTKGLEGVSTLNNLKIVPESDDQDNATIDSAHATETDDGIAIFSHGIVWCIEFDLYIPFRIQKTLAEDHVQFNTRTEIFRVYIHHAYSSPVAFVELVGADESPAPSAAMKVVRKFLARECRDSSHELAFASVGPTPFHADFHIEAHAVQNKGRVFEIRDLDSPGYSDITFFYCASSFDTVQDALRELVYELREELGLFYNIQSENESRYERWNQVERLMSRLVRRSQRTGWRQLVRDARMRSQDLEELSIALADFEADRISGEYATKQAFRSVYKKTSAFLRAYVEAEMEGRPVFPTRPVADLLGFIEGRRLKTLELLAILAAAIVGGVTGSLITILASQ